MEGSRGSARRWASRSGRGAARHGLSGRTHVHQEVVVVRLQHRGQGERVSLKAILAGSREGGVPWCGARWPWEGEGRCEQVEGLGGSWGAVAAAAAASAGPALSSLMGTSGKSRVGTRTCARGCWPASSSVVAGRWSCLSSAGRAAGRARARDVPPPFLFFSPLGRLRARALAQILRGLRPNLSPASAPPSSSSSPSRTPSQAAVVPPAAGSSPRDVDPETLQKDGQERRRLVLQEGLVAPLLLLCCRCGRADQVEGGAADGARLALLVPDDPDAPVGPAPVRGRPARGRRGDARLDGHAVRPRRRRPSSVAAAATAAALLPVDLCLVRCCWHFPLSQAETPCPCSPNVSFIPKLAGVLLSHSALTFLSSAGNILYDCPFAVVDVEFGALVWAPRVGQVLSPSPFLPTGLCQADRGSRALARKRQSSSGVVLVRGSR